MGAGRPSRSPAGSGWKDPEHEISHGSIYRFIYRPKVRKEKLHRFLARAKATRGRRTFKRRREPIPGRRSIHDIVWAIHTTPRKCLGFLTPAEAFLTHLRCCT